MYFLLHVREIINKTMSNNWGTFINYKQHYTSETLCCFFFPFLANLRKGKGDSYILEDQRIVFLMETKISSILTLLWIINTHSHFNWKKKHGIYYLLFHHASCCVSLVDLWHISKYVYKVQDGHEYIHIGNCIWEKLLWCYLSPLANLSCSLRFSCLDPMFFRHFEGRERY